MIGSTLSFTLGGEARTLRRIRDDGYSAEYYGKMSSFDLRVKIYHQTLKNGTLRHYADLEQRIYATETSPMRVNRISGVILHDDMTNTTDTLELSGAYCDWLKSVDELIVEGDS